MRSRALNTAFNRALVDAVYRQTLLAHLRQTLLEANVPEAEIRQLEAYTPTTLEGLAQALEHVHVGTFDS